MTRFGLIVTTALAAMGVGYPGLTPMPIKLIWNASASAPIGFYSIAFEGPFERYRSGRPSMHRNHSPPSSPNAGYLPKGVPLLKRILAVSGQTVCRSNLAITVDGVNVGVARDRDRAGRDLPVWQGCRRIATGEVFLMNWQVNDSLDGRYFGLTSTDQIIGRAVPLWTDEDGDGRFQWRAPTR